MRKVLSGVLVLAVLAVGGGVVFVLTMRPAQRPAPDWQLEATPERLARGEYLGRHVWLCLDCHSTLDATRYGTPIKPGTEGAGGECFTRENSGFPGQVCAQNITPDKDTGVGGWTDGELARAIREGVRRDGTALFPMMPYGVARNLSDEDVKSLVVWLRSLEPINHAVPPGKIDFPVSLLMKFAPQPVASVPEPDRTDSVAYGKYLSYACLECHTPVDERGQRVAGKDFSGGREFRFGDLKVRSANLTPHETGLGPRTKAGFVAQFAAWRAAAELPLVSPRDNTLMPWAQLRHLKDEDLGAIYDYLRTVKPVDNPVPRRSPPAFPPPMAAPPAPAPAEPDDAAAPVAPGNR